YYSATHLEAQLVDGQEIIIVGGGNSAGQTAVFLAQLATRVHVLVRGPGLAESMSRYLIQRLDGTPKVVLRTHSQIEALEGSDRLEHVRWRHLDTGAREAYDIANVFSMTGADPNTAWVAGCLRLDDKKFVKTGGDLLAEELMETRWPMARRPYLMETSTPGV